MNPTLRAAEGIAGLAFTMMDALCYPGNTGHYPRKYPRLLPKRTLIFAVAEAPCHFAHNDYADEKRDAWGRLGGHLAAVLNPPPSWA